MVKLILNDAKMMLKWVSYNLLKSGVKNDQKNVKIGALKSGLKMIKIDMPWGGRKSSKSIKFDRGGPGGPDL
jgi:hypothetical protein